MIDSRTAKELTIKAACAEYLNELDVLVKEAAAEGRDSLTLPDHMTRINSNGYAECVNHYLRGELSSRGYSIIPTRDRKILIKW